MPKSLGTREHRILTARLVELRSSAGLTQRALASLLRVPRSWVAKVETGERRLDLIEFVWWCQAVGVDPPRAAADMIREMSRSRR